MNTISLLLTGHTTQGGISFAPLLLHNLHSDSAMSTRTILLRTPTDLNRTPTMSPSLSRSSSISSTSTIRPGSRNSHKRSSSKDSSQWYNTTENMTLEDFADRLNTLEKRFERFVSQCATNIVMALLRPTPLVLFLFNPVCLIAIAMLVLCWVLVLRGETS